MKVIVSVRVILFVMFPFFLRSFNESIFSLITKHFASQLGDNTFLTE